MHKILKKFVVTSPPNPQVLLHHGANVEDHNENGHTPLMEAASAGHVEVAKVSVCVCVCGCILVFILTSSM